MAITKPSVESVKEIVTTAKGDSVIQTVIDEAALLVERCVKNMSEDRQSAIIRYITAHMLTLMDGKGSGALSSRKLGDAQRSYAAIPLGPNLQSTVFGQLAISLDPNGCLTNIGKTPARIRVV